MISMKNRIRNGMFIKPANAQIEQEALTDGRAVHHGGLNLGSPACAPATAMWGTRREGSKLPVVGSECWADENNGAGGLELLPPRLWDIWKGACPEAPTEGGAMAVVLPVIVPLPDLEAVPVGVIEGVPPLKSRWETSERFTRLSALVEGLGAPRTLESSTPSVNGTVDIGSTGSRQAPRAGTEAEAWGSLVWQIGKGTEDAPPTSLQLS